MFLRGRMRPLNAMMLVCGIMLSVAGCKSSQALKPVATATAPKNFLQAYVVHGEVREVKPEEKTVVIHHEEIPGVMPAMTMPFPVKNLKELNGLHPGDQVSFRMIMTTNEGWVEKIHVTQPAPVVSQTNTTAAPENALPADAPVRVVRNIEPLKVGDPLPDYTFTNQFGAAIHLGQFKGNALAITFIFTRCPFPSFCPQMSGNFAGTQKQLKDMAGAPTNWQLLTLSFDPDYDTPAVLKDYAEQYKYDPAHWNFITGTLVDITALTEQVGLQFWRENPAEPPTHNLRTLVVDAQGRVQKIFPNNTWTSGELTLEMLKAAAAK